MNPLARIDDFAHVIQLAVAPVFLLTAVCTLLAVLINRLGRSVDRRRAIEGRLGDLVDAALATAQAELQTVERRIRLIYAAIAAAVLSAIFVCLLIAIAFLGAFVSVDLTRAAGGFFVLAMLALIASFTVFLREIFLAVTSARSTLR